MTNNNITIPVQGQPQAQARHKTFRRGSKLIQVDPSAEDKKAFAQVVLLQLDKEWSSPLKSAIDVTLYFQMRRPQNHYRTNGEVKEWAGLMPCTKKPDVDNLIKFVFDALNGILWADDSQIIRVTASKSYSNTPCTVIIVSATIT